MSVTECAVCAWRATCNLKFQYQTTSLHCKEYTRDILLPTGKEGEAERPAGTKTGDANHTVDTAE
ncbi:MAG: hypothetical protein HY751_02940 [Nitrospinae bacterium]|nr:hypothetical protein [Nitrospinota bacterium]